MLHSRRTLVSATAAATAGLLTPAIAASDLPLSPTAIASLFHALPGEKAFKVWAPAAASKAAFVARSNASARLFVGSAVKTFILCEALRQADGPDIVRIISQRGLTLNQSV